VGEVACAEELLAHAAVSSPDVVLLDWSVGGTAADKLMVALRCSCQGVGVIVLSGRPEARAQALAAGADAFVSKGDPPEHLLAAIAGWRPDGTAEVTGRDTFREAPAATLPSARAWR